MKRLTIVKLGGSIATDKKGGRAVVRAARVRRIALLIKKAHARGAPIVLLYGGGSFGHPVAHRFRINGRAVTKRSFEGIGRTIGAMRALGDALADILLDAGLPVVPLQTSSCMRVRAGRARFSDPSLIEDILARGGIPLLGGDAAFSNDGRSAIISADAIAVELARSHEGARIIFATDVDGVYATFPPRRGERPLPQLSRAQIPALLARLRPHGSATDVTGAMPGKLKALLGAKRATAVVCNGRDARTVALAFAGERVGTRILL